jgi:hypothetical protein
MSKKVRAGDVWLVDQLVAPYPVPAFVSADRKLMLLDELGDYYPLSTAYYSRLRTLLVKGSGSKFNLLEEST